MKAPKSKIALLLTCGLTLAAMPCAFAGDAKGTPDAMFKMADTNSDGKVSRAEQAASAQKMFTDADSNHDGTVTLVEMEAAHTKMKADHAKSDKPMKEAMSAAEMFKQCDQNSDGKISQAEHVKHAETMFAKMDTDSDGSLSSSECSAGHEKMLKDKKGAH